MQPQSSGESGHACEQGRRARRHPHPHTHTHYDPQLGLTFLALNLIPCLSLDLSLILHPSRSSSPLILSFSLGLTIDREVAGRKTLAYLAILHHPPSLIRALPSLAPSLLSNLIPSAPLTCKRSHVGAMAQVGTEEAHAPKHGCSADHVHLIAA